MVRQKSAGRCDEGNCTSLRCPFALSAPKSEDFEWKRGCFANHPLVELPAQSARVVYGLATNFPRLPRSPFLNSARRLQPHPEWTGAQS